MRNVMKSNMDEDVKSMWLFLMLDVRDGKLTMILLELSSRRSRLLLVAVNAATNWNHSSQKKLVLVCISLCRGRCLRRVQGA